MFLSDESKILYLAKDVSVSARWAHCCDIRRQGSEQTCICSSLLENHLSELSKNPILSSSTLFAPVSLWPSFYCCRVQMSHLFVWVDRVHSITDLFFVLVHCDPKALCFLLLDQQTISIFSAQSRSFLINFDRPCSKCRPCHLNASISPTQNRRSFLLEARLAHSRSVMYVNLSDG